MRAGSSVGPVISHQQVQVLPEEEISVDHRVRIQHAGVDVEGAIVSEPHRDGNPLEEHLLGGAKAVQVVFIQAPV